MARIAKGKNIPNRAWFYAENGSAPPTFHVMWDNSQPGYHTDFKLCQPFNPEKNTLPIIFNVRNNKWGTQDYVRTWDFLPNSTMTVPLVNSRALALLEQIAPGQFEALPTELRFEVDGSVITDYQVINVLNQIDCVDREHSVFKYKNGEIDPWDQFERCYFHLDCLPEGMHMARDKAEFVPLVFSNTLYKEIKERKLTGTKLRDYYADISFWFGER